MDFSPPGNGANGSPVTLNSQRGSSSHSSFTPPRDASQAQLYPHTTCPPNTTNPSVPATEAAFLHATEEDLTGFNSTQLFPPPVGFSMHPWEFNGGEQISTGLTPVSDAPLAWGQMLESLGGWEGAGQRHEF